MASVTMFVTIDHTRTRTGVWCPCCLLPSAHDLTVVVVGECGAYDIGVVTVCGECGQEVDGADTTA